MRARVARLGVLIAAVLGLMATMTPAQASWVKNVTLVGSAQLSNCPGLAYPGVTGVTGTTPSTDTTVKTDPKGVPVVNINPGGNHCDFSFAAACVKESVGKKNGVDLCTILAVGKVWGFCGLSTGEGTASLFNDTGTIQPKPTVSTNFKFTGVGGTLVVTGGTATQNIHGEVTAVPPPSVPPGGNSCTNKSALTFTIAGDVAIKHLN